MAKEFTFTVDSDFDYTIDEKGNTFIALRKIDWGNKGEYKLDLRKYYASETGETMSKGLSFLTDDGPDELTKVLIETGYGDDEEIANTIIDNRPELMGRLCNEMNKRGLSASDFETEYEDEEFYDPEEILA